MVLMSPSNGPVLRLELALVFLEEERVMPQSDMRCYMLDQCGIESGS